MNLLTNIKKLSIAKLVLPFLLLASSLAHAVLPKGLDVSIEMGQSNYSASDPLLVKVTYTNNSNEGIDLLMWDTALEGRINHDFLSINGNSGTLQYVGRLYKRGEPTANDYVSIPVGGSIEETVDLLDAYQVSAQGNYSITYKEQVRDIRQLTKQAKTTFKLTQNRPIEAFKRPSSFQNCSSSRISLINTAVTDAERLAKTAKNDLNATPVSSRASAARFKEWFGSYSSANANRWTTVKQHFDKIYSALANQSLKFICDDTTGAFAYVYPSQPYDVYLGTAFWNAPATGTDSKAGTVIHELSHFTVLGGTDDHQYGQTGARQLAISNPTLAIDNADSHEYFAENTPALSMPGPPPPPPEFKTIAPIYDLLFTEGTPTPAAVCQTSLARSASDTRTLDYRCPSSNRAGKYAHFYQFELTSSAEVTIDVTSTEDTYAYLISGSDTAGAVIVSDDDGGDSYNSRITQTLTAGTYLIESTTYNDFIRATITTSLNYISL